MQHAGCLVRDGDGGGPEAGPVLVDEFNEIQLPGDEARFPGERGEAGFRGGHDAPPVIRDAASFPEISTIGTPTPG
nr:hypothetical protein Ade03nite_43540 [Actinoplanes derwentensis]